MRESKLEEKRNITLDLEQLRWNFDIKKREDLTQIQSRIEKLKGARQEMLSRKENEV